MTNAALAAILAPADESIGRQSCQLPRHSSPAGTQWQTDYSPDAEVNVMLKAKFQKAFLTLDSQDEEVSRNATGGK